MADPLNIASAFLEMTTRLMTDPAKLLQSQISLWQAHMDLWQSAALRMMGSDAKAAVPSPDDRRFKDAAWEENQLFDFIKQSYLLTARWLTQTVREVDGLDEKTAKKVDFYTRQFVDAMAASRFDTPELVAFTVAPSAQAGNPAREYLFSYLYSSPFKRIRLVPASRSTATL